MRWLENHGSPEKYSDIDGSLTTNAIGQALVKISICQSLFHRVSWKKDLGILYGQLSFDFLTTEFVRYFIMHVFAKNIQVEKVN